MSYLNRIQVPWVEPTGIGGSEQREPEQREPEKKEPEKKGLERKEPEKKEPDMEKSAADVPVLYVTDDAQTARSLRERGEAVLIYLHEDNQDQDFSDFFYAVEEPENLDPEYVDKVYRRLKGLPWDILETERCLIRETTPEDVNEFLTKALREQAINAKNPFEVICWYCYKNGYNYLKF